MLLGARLAATLLGATLLGVTLLGVNAHAQPTREPGAVTSDPAIPEADSTMRFPSPDAAAQAAEAHASHVRAARGAVAARRWADADRHFEAALELDPDDAALLAERGEAFASARERGRAALAFERAVELTDDPARRAAGLVRLGRFIEPTDRARARRLFVRALALAPQSEPLIEPLDAVYDASLELMSPSTLCPSLAELWGCTPPRRGVGVPCRCSVERMTAPPPPDTTSFAAPAPGALTGAAVLRLRDGGARGLDVAYLVVQTRSGGWQIVDRVSEGWRPGAPYVRRAGRITRFDLLPIGGEAGEDAEDRVLVVRAEGERVDGDFEADRVTRARFELMWVCAAQPAPVCVRIPLASTVQTRPLRAAATSAPTVDVAYALDAAVSATPEAGAVVEVQARSGTPPAGVGALVGRWPLDALAPFDAAWVVPLR
ncbi:MAG: hypothetical protein R3F65_32545 [bacterium]